MAKKVYTLGVDEKNLSTSKKSTNTAKTVSKVQNEVENFGIVEINNASSAKKVKNTNDKGFEKNLVDSKKKAVNQKINHVDDYFDFSFRPEKKSAKAGVASTKKTAKTEEVVNEKKVATATYRAEKEDMVESRKANEAEAVSERFDEEVARVICVARMGSLFDCEKRMIQL